MRKMCRFYFLLYDFVWDGLHDIAMSSNNCSFVSVQLLEDLLVTAKNTNDEHVTVGRGQKSKELWVILTETTLQSKNKFSLIVWESFGSTTRTATLQHLNVWRNSKKSSRR